MPSHTTTAPARDAWCYNPALTGAASHTSPPVIHTLSPAGGRTRRVHLGTTLPTPRRAAAVIRESTRYW